ncbi:peptide/nickel transport system permease protein [Rhodobium orientis]|uniref:Diguanylate cyclase n=1 Tax=Rhodobium orientis TaxID=34017 RepID=A0A327JPC6_9HYPH|nr:ABC transporter permease [Rhodobium orientis]MBB4303547.1 peptide/nickel transport system permease protein [Rhodobium orientis]MBK5950476.1 diguanylate cyclase [Rhodobium orientis]RAI28309.1 diguanylate cyclase [Rhodobium orientis]
MTDVSLPADPVVGGGHRKSALQQVLSQPSAVIGGSIVVFFVLVAIFAPLLSPFDPNASDWLAIRQAPSAVHWFGTDDLGRDILSRILFGARASLLAGVIAVAIAIAIGVPLGLIAGYFGGLLDAVISRCTDALLAVPFLVLAIALAAFLGASLQNAMIAIGVSAVPIFIRLTRGQVLVVKGEDYITAARAVGVRDRNIIVSHVFPNVLAPVVVQGTITMAVAILAEASLAFLGLGQRPPAPSWGSMLDVARQFLTEAPWMAVWPGLAIVAIVLGFNLLGDGLNDALNPHRDTE